MPAFENQKNTQLGPSNFLHLFTLHVAKKFSFNILRTISLKITKKTSIEAQNEGEVKATWPIDDKESKKDALLDARDFSDSSPVVLKEMYGECYPHTLAPNPEMKAVTYTW